MNTYPVAMTTEQKPDPSSKRGIGYPLNKK